jgi:autotransporter-associated beta strand protein
MQTITRQLRFVIAGFLLFAYAQHVSGATWTFLVYGDSRAASGSGINAQILGELATQTLVENPLFVLFPGDLVGTGGQTVYNTWKSTMQPVYDAGIGVCPIAGNHEASGGQSALNAFKSTFITPYTTTPFAGMTNMVVDSTAADGRSYAFNFNNALFLCMDNYSNASTSAHMVNQAFLDAQLAARNPTTTPLVFAMWHEPAFKAGQDTGLEAKPTQRNATWTSLQNAGCRQVFNGHDHLYAASRLDDGDGNPDDDTYQVVVGTAGAPLYSVAYSGDTGSWTVVPISSESSYGYVRVVVDDVAQTVVQTWVHRTAANTFVDTTSVVSYSYGATWTNSAASGNWSTPASWNPATVPISGAAVTFGTGGSTSVVDTVSRTVDTIIFNRATDFVVSASGGAGLTINRGVTVNNSFTYTIAAPVTLARPNTWTVNGPGALQVSGIISGSNSLTKAGSGTLTLSGINTYSSGTTVSNGCLLVTGSIGTGIVTVTSGATLAGNGVIGGPVTIASGAILAPAGTLTINSNLTLTNGAILNYGLGTTSDQTAVTGNLQLAGVLNITDAGGFGTGTYTLFTYTGALSNNGLTVGTTPDADLVYQIDTSIPGQVQLIVLTQFAAWQMQYFGCTSCPEAAADADSDGDGMSNTNEFLAGTVPTNNASAFRIVSIAREGNDVRITWNTVTNRSYDVWVAVPQASGSYTNAFNPVPLNPFPIAGTETTAYWLDLGGAASGPLRYYRVSVLPP